jgi:glycosyltransferase involved in cell wall biosynthesis
VENKNALILCNDYNAPFLSVAKEYASYFNNTDSDAIVVFLKGKKDSAIEKEVSAKKVIFLEATNKELSGFKGKLTKQIRKLHHQYQFQFIVAHRYRAIFIATQLKDIPVFGVCHIDGNFKRLSRKLYIRFFGKNLTLIGVSKAIRDDVRKSLPFIKKEKIVHLYNSLDFETLRALLLDRSAAKKALAISETDYCFVNVGRLHEDKDQATLINAFVLALPQMPQAKLYIAGAGRLESALKHQVEKLNLQENITFLGKVPEVFRYLRAFDCFVLSSIREGLPVALLEAYAAELPPIASKCTGNTEAIEGVTEGFEIGHHGQLAALMIKNYEMPPAKKNQVISRLNHKLNVHFTNEAVKTQFWKIVGI